MELTIENVKNNKLINTYIKASGEKMKACGFTDHGFRHANIVSERAMMIAKELGFSQKEIQYSAIAGYCHDMGNFMGRNLHHHWGSVLFNNVFSHQTDDMEGLINIMEAISNHEKPIARITNKSSAALIIADKSDVHVDRVFKTGDKSRLEQDIHDRVNTAVTHNELLVKKQEKIIELKLTLDTNITPIMDYFIIFSERMDYCRVSAKYLGYTFSLVINDVKLL